MSLDGELRELVKQWLAYDDEIKSLRKAVSERSKLQKKIGEQILEFMDENEIQDLKTTKGNLKYHISEKKVNPTPEDVRVKLMEKLGNPKMVEEVYNSIYNSDNATIEKVSLKRTEETKSKEKNANDDNSSKQNQNKGKSGKKPNPIGGFAPTNYNQNSRRRQRMTDDEYNWE